MVKLSKFLMLFCIVLLCSCSKAPISCFTPPAPIQMKIVDREGNDLLNPSNQSGYKFSSISLYQIDDGRKKYYQVVLDSLRDKKTYYLSTNISWNADKGNEFTLQLSPTVTDKIYLRYDQASDDDCTFYKFVEFRYNDIILNHKVDGNFQHFEIIK